MCTVVKSAKGDARGSPWAVAIRSGKPLSPCTHPLNRLKCTVGQYAYSLECCPVAVDVPCRQAQPGILTCDVSDKKNLDGLIMSQHRGQLYAHLVSK